MTMNVVETTIEEGNDTTLYLQKMGFHNNDGLRITWISTYGVVLFESDYDKGVMENHLERPEVRAAIANGEGMAVRDSQTVSKALYYYAKRLPDGTIFTGQSRAGYLLRPFPEPSSLDTASLGSVGLGLCQSVAYSDSQSSQSFAADGPFLFAKSMMSTLR